jgi:thiol-disulfide isomerase/thioredoxin
MRVVSRSGRGRGAFAVGVLLVSGLGAGDSAGRDSALIPEFTQTAPQAWLNTAPLTLASLRGRPVLVEFWTFGCSNCRNTLPWLRHVHQRYGPEGLVVVGVHTPEFPHEREPDAVRRAVDRLGIRYPVMLDNDFGYWRALENRYWPAFYLVDAEGRMAATRIGELHQGRSEADAFERRIAAAVAAASTRRTRGGEIPGQGEAPPRVGE